MGLEGVELLIAVEEKFGITITDEDANALHTIGDILALVKRRLHENSGISCLSSHLFYALRRAFITQFGVTRRQVTLDAPLVGLLPSGDRRRQWQQLGEELGCSMPNLLRPRWMTVVILAVPLLIIWNQFELFSPLDLAVFIIVALVPSLLCLWILWRATSMHARCIPPSCATVRGLVASLLKLNHHGTNLRLAGQWQDDQLWPTLQQVICDELKVKPEKVREETRLYGELMSG